MNQVQENDRRCPECDSRLPAESGRCLMCGYDAAEQSGSSPSATPADASLLRPGHAALPVEGEAVSPASATSAALADGQEKPEEDGVVTSVVRERHSTIVFWMTAVVFVVTALIGTLVLKYGGPVELALLPTVTPIPPTPSFTPTVTLPPTETVPPTLTPTVTPLPSATPTPEPPRVHNVGEGDTLFGLSFSYNVSMDSIASTNGFSLESPLQQGQVLQIPWPTATPPLEPVAIDLNGEIVIADPRNCERYEIQQGDAISVIAARQNINQELLLRVNRLTEQSIVQPGDTICIPEIIHGDILPPTPGPSPTPSPTGFPRGPRPLYPPPGTTVESAGPLVLQWVAVKDLEPDEWYMVEVTDVSEVNAHPQRGFTRQTSFPVPSSWRPAEVSVHDFRWRVSIVRVTGQRADGALIYTFGGRPGDENSFSWLGAVPTPTSTPTPTPQPSAG